MYIRIKQHKNHKYAYLVKTKRYKRKKYPKQIVVKYLGKVLTPKKPKPLAFKNYINKEINLYFKETKLRNIFLDLIKLEQKRHNLKLDLNNLQLVYELNEGFLCDYTLQQLLNLKIPLKASDKEKSLLLANTILSTGIKLPPYLFIKIFQKIHNP
ncbi:MAG: hypothetical protein CMH62_02855 [Nanoarchaeota archaeon]|nr:hypothetical protein [Nanoarchaeota archaeon]|tara:strand:- start:259 stop:723 length:465 start_codon:yes stop_codon:yes gene_type:complete